MSTSPPIRLDATYLLLTGHDAEHLAGGEVFWEQLGTDSAMADRVGRGWLVGEFPTEQTWDQWEMHPDGDELVHLATGEIDFHLDTLDDPTRMVAGDSVVVPRGTWHTVTVRQPGRLLNVTWGRDTQTRPRPA